MLQAKRYEGLDSLPPSYHSVFANAGRESFFLSLPWFRNFERTILGSQEASLIYGIENGPRPEGALGALVLWRKQEKRRVFSPARIEGLANYYTSYFAPVIASDYPDNTAVLSAFANGMSSDSHLWDVCNFLPLDQDSSIFSSLIKAFRDVGMAVQTYFCFGNWYLQVNGRPYSEYVKTLPSVLKETIRRKGNKLEKHRGVRIEIITEIERVPVAVEDYTKIYLASWKKPEPFPRFMPGLIRTCAEMGWLRLGMAYVDDEPVATQLWIVNHGVASIYKLAYDERFANLSVGTVLTARLMQYVIDVDKVAVVDYLTGDDAYKKDWMSHRRERWGILVFNLRTINGRLQAARHIGGRSLKTAARAVLQRVL
jgi:Acetyltransferase (GNAT) domain